jgi:hypothetical protein
MAEFQTIASEREDLRTHVELCSQRYLAVEQRLERVERALWAMTAVVAATSGPVAAAHLPHVLRILGGG